MIYGHVCEVINADTKEKLYTLVIREFCAFHDNEERMNFTSLIRATFVEPGGDYGILFADISQWAATQKITIFGLQENIARFTSAPEVRVAQLERRIIQMATLMQTQRDTIDSMMLAEEQESAQIEGEECKAHEQLDELKEIIQCAQQNGCRHIADAIAEIRAGGSHGH